MPPSTPKPQDEFIRKITKLDRSLSNRDKFRDFCELAYCAYAKLAAPTKERADELEAQYMRIVDRYQDKDTVRAYPELLAIAQMAVEDGGCDFLGEVSGQLEVLDSYKGQFFTPYSVSRMMAQMLIKDADKVLEQDGYITILEPASGAGGMVLACADVIQGLGYNPMTSMLVHTIDISPLCYHMCYLQLTWRGVPAFVNLGDTLRLEMYEGAWTVHALPFRWHHGHLSFDKKQTAASRIREEPEPVTEHMQLKESNPPPPEERTMQLRIF